MKRSPLIGQSQSKFDLCASTNACAPDLLLIPLRMPFSIPFRPDASLLHSPAFHRRRKVLRTIAFACSLLNWSAELPYLLTCSLTAGSILLYSLYAPLFQTHLGFSQLEINAIFIAGEVGMYLTVP